MEHVCCRFGSCSSGHDGQLQYHVIVKFKKYDLLVPLAILGNVKVITLILLIFSLKSTDVRFHTKINRGTFAFQFLETPGCVNDEFTIILRGFSNCPTIIQSRCVIIET